MVASSHHQIITDVIDSDLTIGDHIRFLVTSNSMQPILSIGDTIIVEIINGKQAHIGDILLFKRSNDFLAHRVISKTVGGWITKGDNNTLPDPPTNINEIVGRVKFVLGTQQTINLYTRKWQVLNRLLANLSDLESLAFSHHVYLRIPFRMMIKVIQKLSTIQFR
jgi:signal peptidase I